MPSELIHADLETSSAAAAPSASSLDAVLPDGEMADERTELRARVARLEHALQDMRQRHLADLKALRQSQHLLNAILDNTTATIFVKDTSGRFILVNRRFETLHSRPRSELLGKTSFDLLPSDIAQRIADEDRAILAGGEPIEYEDLIPDSQGEVRAFLTIKFSLTDASGAITGLCGIGSDITERKRAAEERTALQQQIIETQRAALRELSSPLIPLADGVLVVPLIGSIDPARAQQIVESLLDGVRQQHAQTVILDITGVRVVDTTVTQGLVRAARAVKLLGAECILTGVRADVAQTLVHIGADLGDVVTLSTLQAGIAYALRKNPGLPEQRAARSRSR